MILVVNYALSFPIFSVLLSLNIITVSPILARAHVFVLVGDRFVWPNMRKTLNVGHVNVSTRLVQK